MALSTVYPSDFLWEVSAVETMKQKGIQLGNHLVYHLCRKSEMDPQNGVLFISISRYQP